MPLQAAAPGGEVHSIASEAGEVPRVTQHVAFGSRVQVIDRECRSLLGSDARRLACLFGAQAAATRAEQVSTGHRTPSLRVGGRHRTARLAARHDSAKENHQIRKRTDKKVSGCEYGRV